MMDKIRLDDLVVVDKMRASNLHLHDGGEDVFALKLIGQTRDGTAYEHTYALSREAVDRLVALMVTVVQS